MVEGLARAGRVDEAFAVVQEAIDRCERDDERWALAEFLRLKGELVSQRDETAAATSDTFFEQAMDLARGQGALSWELRAATSLARLWHGQNRRSEALALPAARWQGVDSCHPHDWQTRGLPEGAPVSDRWRGRSLPNGA